MIVDRLNMLTAFRLRSKLETQKPVIRFDPLYSKMIIKL